MNAQPLARAIESFVDSPELASSAWHEISDRLWDQGRVESASFAALPHLVVLCADHPELGGRVLGLVALIETARLEGRAVPPPDLQECYQSSLKRLREESLTLVKVTSQSGEAIGSSLQGFAALRYCDSPVVAAIDRLAGGDDLELQGSCDECTANLVVETGAEGRFVMGANQAGKLAGQPRELHLLSNGQVEHGLQQGAAILAESACPDWELEESALVLAALAGQIGYTDLAAQLLRSFASIRCPRCAATICPTAVGWSVL